MRRIIILFIVKIVMGFVFLINAQDNTFNYQAVIRNQEGTPIEESSVELRLSILKNSTSGPVYYTETHNVSTNGFGLVNFIVGTGTTSQSIDTINWAEGRWFLQNEINVEGTGYQLMNTSEIVSVPKANYAKNAGYAQKSDTSKTAQNIQGVDLYQLLSRITYLEKESGYSVRDIEGNTYRAVKIGNQIWMAESLRTMKDPSGNPLSHRARWLGDAEEYGEAGYEPDMDNDGDIDQADSILYVQKYGLMYDLPTALNQTDTSKANPSGVQGICPDGWHVPSIAEWNELLSNFDNSQVNGPVYIINGLFTPEAIENYNDYDNDDLDLSIADTSYLSLNLGGLFHDDKAWGFTGYTSVITSDGITLDADLEFFEIFLQSNYGFLRCVKNQ